MEFDMAESVGITEEAYDDVIVNKKTRFTSLITGLFNEIEQKNEQNGIRVIEWMKVKVNMLNRQWNNLLKKILMDFAGKERGTFLFKICLPIDH